MEYKLLIDPRVCVGCRLCELACSVYHEKEYNPTRSRIRVLKDEKLGLDVPVTCLHCDPAYCIKACPTGALVRDEKTGAVILKTENCITCGLCISICPFGAPSFDSGSSRVIKCDLCDGDPRCVKFCGTKAITYDKASRVGLAKKRKEVRKIEKLLSSTATS